MRAGELEEENHAASLAGLELTTRHKQTALFFLSQNSRNELLVVMSRRTIFERFLSGFVLDLADTY